MASIHTESCIAPDRDHIRHSLPLSTPASSLQPVPLSPLLPSLHPSISLDSFIPPTQSLFSPSVPSLGSRRVPESLTPPRPTIHTFAATSQNTAMRSLPLAPTLPATREQSSATTAWLCMYSTIAVFTAITHTHPSGGKTPRRRMRAARPASSRPRDQIVHCLTALCFGFPSRVRCCHWSARCERERNKRT